MPAYLYILPLKHFMFYQMFNLLHLRSDMLMLECMSISCPAYRWQHHTVIKKRTELKCAAGPFGPLGSRFFNCGETTHTVANQRTH